MSALTTSPSSTEDHPSMIDREMTITTAGQTFTSYFGFRTFPDADNYGPITSTFTPAPSCTRVAVQTGVPYNPTSSGIVVGGRSDCYPGNRLYDLHYGVMTVASLFYSPALFCPYGYTTAATWRTALASSLGEETVLNSSEEAYYCCPSSYTFGQEGNCFSKLIPGDVVTHERLEYGMWTEDSKTTLDEPATAMAWSIQIRFQSSDSTRYPVSTSSTTASQTSVVAGVPPASKPTSDPTSNSTSISTSSSTSNSTLNSTSTPASTTKIPPSGGLTTTAKIAIGITIPMICVACLLGIFFYFRRRRRRERARRMARPSRLQPTMPTQGPGISWRAEMDVDSPSRPTAARSRLGEGVYY